MNLRAPSSCAYRRGLSSVKTATMRPLAGSPTMTRKYSVDRDDYECSPSGGADLVAHIMHCESGTHHEADQTLKGSEQPTRVNR